MPDRSRGGRLPLRVWNPVAPLMSGEAVSDLTRRCSRVEAARARLVGGSRVPFNMLSVPRLPVLWAELTLLSW